MPRALPGSIKKEYQMCRWNHYLWKIPCQVEEKAVYIFTLTISDNIGYYLTPWKKVEVVFSVIQENKA